MSAPTESLAALRTSTAALLHGVEAQGWNDVDVHAPSLLPDWSRAHVLSHVARNADGITRTLAGALRGEVLARYPNGREGRDADIEAGATRGGTQLVTDVRESAQRLDATFDAVAEADGWALPTEDLPARDYVLARWREVEIHRIDLAGVYTPDQWPAAFVAYLLPEVASDLSEPSLRIEVASSGSVAPELVGRVWTVGGEDAAEVTGPDWALLAWLLGRTSPAAGALNATPQVQRWR